jgi:ubiquitin-protein ligase
MTDRNERLRADFYDMLSIRNRPYLSWTATKGDLPCAEEYLLDIRLRSYALSADHGRYTVGVTHGCTVKVTLWDSYPETAPYIKMLSLPPVFHPCWYSKGVYCPPRKWRADCSLKDYILEMLRTLRYDPELIESDAPANYKALDWYLKHRDDTALFPSDTTELSENSPQTAEAFGKSALCFDEIVDSWGIK